MNAFEQHLSRQTALLAQLKPNSIVVIRGASEITRSNDTHFPFRQDSDFFYLTGFNEPDSWLILSNRSDDESGSAFRAMAVRPSNKQQEIWHGRRLGVEQAKTRFELDECIEVDELPEALFSMLKGHENLYACLGHHPEADIIIQQVISRLRAAKDTAPPACIVDWQPLVHEMRLFKSDAEMVLLRKAIELSMAGHKRAMQFAKPGVFEYQFASEIHHTFTLGGAHAPAYGTIVGAGENACILHYTENTDVVGEDSLVLIDAGAEYQGYAGDITRTFPASGKFNDVQKAIYNLVLEAQLVALEHLQPGKLIPKANEAVVKTLTQGLVKLGLLEGDVDLLIEEKAYRRFYMHGLGHWLGLDVHDVGLYKINGEDRPLEAGMVMTVEPGLYIPNEDDIPKQYRGIGVRIEDNIVITATGHEVLTADLPKTVEGIEALMGEQKQ